MLRPVLEAGTVRIGGTMSNTRTPKGPSDNDQLLRTSSVHGMRTWPIVQNNKLSLMFVALLS